MPGFVRYGLLFGVIDIQYTWKVIGSVVLIMNDDESPIPQEVVSVEMHCIRGLVSPTLSQLKFANIVSTVGCISHL